MSSSSISLRVREIRPQTSRWRDTVLHPGDTVDLDAEFPRPNLAGTGNWSWTVPVDPVCYLCGRPFCDGDEVELYVRFTGNLSTIEHWGCWIDTDGIVHPYDEHAD